MSRWWRRWRCRRRGHPQRPVIGLPLLLICLCGERSHKTQFPMWRA